MSIYNNSMVEASAQTPIQGFAPNHFYALASGTIEFDVVPGTIWQTDIDGSFNYDNGSVVFGYGAGSTYVIPRGASKLYLTLGGAGSVAFAGAAQPVTP